MESTGYRPAILLGIAALLVLLVSFLVARARRADREAPTDEMTRARLRRVYLCFLLMNVLGVIVGAGMILIHVKAENQEGMGMLGGMILVVTVWSALPVAAYNSLFLWRRRSVQVLWLLVLLLISVFVMFENVLPEMAGNLIVLGYLVATSALVVRGLLTLRQGRPV